MRRLQQMSSLTSTDTQHITSTKLWKLKSTISRLFSFKRRLTAVNHRKNWRGDGTFRAFTPNCFGSNIFSHWQNASAQLRAKLTFVDVSMSRQPAKNRGLLATIPTGCPSILANPTVMFLAQSGMISKYVLSSTTYHTQAKTRVKNNLKFPTTM